MENDELNMGKRTPDNYGAYQSPCGRDRVVKTYGDYLFKTSGSEGSSYEEGERAKLFFADISRKEAQLQEIDSFLNKAFSGSLGLMVKTMIKDEKLSEEEIEELEDMLKRAKGE